MSEKAEAKYAQLWAAYVMARAQRRDCLSRELPETAVAFAAQDLSGDADGPVEVHLAALAAERKALKKLVKYARKHGADVLPARAAPVVDEPPATKEAAARGKGAKTGAKAARATDLSARAAAAVPAPTTRGRRAPKTAAGAAPKVRAQAKAGVSPAALTTAEVPPTPPARPRRSPAKPKPMPPRGPRGPAKA